MELITTTIRQRLHALLITDGCLCESCEPACEQCPFCQLETTLAMIQLAPVVQQLVTAVLGYMEYDEDSCLCEPCSPPPPLCQGCIYCVAWNALAALGYVEHKEAPDP